MTSLELIAIAEALPGQDLPGLEVSNLHLSQSVGDFAQSQGLTIELPDPKFPEERVGVLCRRFLDHRFSSVDLATKAARKALDQAAIPPTQVRAVIVTSVTSPQAVPPVATTIHDELKLEPEVAAFDSPIGCNGFLGGLRLAQTMLAEEPDGSCAMLVTSEAMSRVLQATDRATSVIFGDGAAATILRKASRSEAGRLGAVAWFTQGKKGPLITIVPGPAPTYRFHVDEGQLTLKADPHSSLRVQMQGRQVFRDMVTDLPRRIVREFQVRGRQLEDYDLFAFHQANQRIVDAVASHLKIPEDRLYSNIHKLGNTTSASIPLLLLDAARAGRLRPGHKVMLLGFGTGYSVGLAELTWHPDFAHYSGLSEPAQVLQTVASL